jgi:choline dehydrogenase
VIGAGTAGCVIARRLLDRTDATVLVLEAGGEDTNPAIHDPMRTRELWHGPEDWDYHTCPQPDAANRVLHLPRGRVLGGSHALNSTSYVRGNPDDYDAWALLGNPGWGWADIAPLFARIERYDTDESGLKGTDGMLDILSSFTPDPVQQAIVAAAREIGIPANSDHNTGPQEGVGPVHFTIRDGVRVTTADVYLKPAVGHPRLLLCTGARVHRLFAEHGRLRCVTGVLNGRPFRAFPNAEIVLAAGAIESAALLLRSGIGPAAELRAAGVPVFVDLPGVGRNLLDHWQVPVVFGAERRIEHTPGLPHAQTQLFWRSEPGLAGQDLRPLHVSVPLYEPWMSGPPNGFTLLAGLVRPASTGRITITGPDPDTPPTIDPKVLSQRADLLRLTEAVRLCRQIGAARALREWGATERYPDPNADPHDYVRRAVTTCHHQAGTCRMGVDNEAVVDPELRVHGVAGLRVVDASVMPTLPTGNTNAPTILIAEKAADLMTTIGATRTSAP